MSLCRLQTSSAPCSGGSDPSRGIGWARLGAIAIKALRLFSLNFTYRRERRARIDQLSALSDRQLLDIGVDRSDIVKIVEKTMRRN